MTDLAEPFFLKIQDSSNDSFVVESGNLHEVFTLVERKKIDAPLEVYRGDERVGSLKRSTSGIWVINWSSPDIG